MTRHTFSKFIILTLITFVLDSGVSSHEQSNGNSEQQQPFSRSPNGGQCPKTWIHLGQRCYKIAHNPRNYESARSRCYDLTSQLAAIEDESAKEKESAVGVSSALSASNIVAYLSSDQRKSELQTRQYYVTISAELLSQHNERLQSGFYADPGQANGGSEVYDHIDPDISGSELWLPRDDPSLSNLAANLTDKATESNIAFVLAYSRLHRRWGLVPVLPTRKMSFICERSSNLSSPARPSDQAASSQGSPGQQQNIEPKRASDLSGQDSRGISFSYNFNQHQPTQISSTSSSPPDRKLTTEKEADTTPMPDTSAMLFREFPQDQSIVLGSTAEMRCSALESESGLSWTFNGKNITQSNRVRLHQNGTLKIEHVRNIDDGNYTCTIHAGSMKESKSARLEIIERPHQPEYITAELLDKLSTSVRIKWTPGFNGNSPIKKYLVEMRTVDRDNIDNEMSSLMQSNQWEVAKANISADQTSVIIPDLKPARKYIFRIKATNRVGTGDPSLPTRFPIEVPVQPPSMPPENLVGSAKSSTSITIQWSPPPADSQNGVLKGYKIRHKLAGYASDSDWYTNDVGDAAHLTFVLEDLIVWQNYEIQVAAENDKGIGPFSSSIYIRTKEGKPDKGPRNVTAESISPVAIRVIWNPPPPQHINGLNQGYKVHAWYDPQHTQLAKDLLVPHNTASPHHSATIDGLQPYTDYYINVICFTLAGDGPPNEDSVRVKTKEDLPEAVPVLEFSDVLDTSLRILWKPPKRINGELDHYTLEYSESSSLDKKILKNFPAGATEARITDLIPQTPYKFKIYPHTNVGQGPGTANHTTTSVPPVLPEPPTNLVYSNVEAYSVTIQFNPGFDGNASIEKWIADALTPARGEYASRWQNIYNSTDHSRGNSIVIRNLKPFTRYKIRLTPVNIVGPSIYPSEPTMEFQTAQVEPEQAPKDLSVEEVKSNSAIARWSPLANNHWLGHPKGYNLTWTNNSTAASPFTMSYLINDTRADSFLVRDLEEFAEYSFRIYAVNEAGSSPPSDPVSVTTLEDVPSSGPSNLTAHALSSNAISVDWNLVPKRHRNGIIRGYRIQYQALKPEGAPLQHKTVEDNNTRHVTLNDLKAFTTYHLAVAAYTNAGDGVYSTVLNVQTLEDSPGKPQNLSFPTLSQTSARILWDPPEEPNGDIIGYKVAYHTLAEGSKEVASHELHQNERTFKATNLKPDTHYVFTVTAKTKEGWGQQASVWVYTHDSELRANLPFYRESWFVILCASLSIVITIIITALLYVQTKSYKYKQDAIKSTSQDRLGDAGFTIDDDAPGNHYQNGFGLLSHVANHRRSNGALSQGTANFTLPKSPPRPHPGSVVYSDEGDDDVFEDIVDKPTGVKSTAGTSNYDDSSSDSVTEKPSERSSSTAPESNESMGDEYVTMASKHFVNHYANINGTLRGQRAWKKSAKHYSSHRTKPKFPQRPAPSVPQVPGSAGGEPSSSGSDNMNPIPGPSGTNSMRPSSSIYGESQVTPNPNQQSQSHLNTRSILPHQDSDLYNRTNGTTCDSNGNDPSINNNLAEKSNQNNTQQGDLLGSHIVNLNGGRMCVSNIAGSRAPLPGFTSFV